jgi:hypothetical protein
MLCLLEHKTMPAAPGCQGFAGFFSNPLIAFFSYTYRSNCSKSFKILAKTTLPCSVVVRTTCSVVTSSENGFSRALETEAGSARLTVRPRAAGRSADAPDDTAARLENRLNVPILNGNGALARPSTAIS